MEHFPIDPPCKEWGGAVNKDGYGKASHKGKFWLAHRLAWTLERGPIPQGLTVHHKCWNRACVNVEHMELMTADENKKKNLISLSGVCRNGHIYTDSTSYFHAGLGRKFCRACNLAAVKRYQERNPR